MTKLLEQRDSDGNRMIAAVFPNGNWSISIQLISEKRQRLAGTVDSKEKTFFIKRKRSKHLHYKTNSYGFNDSILRGEPKIEKVVLRDEYGIYIIPVAAILEQGKYLYFKQSGFEKQIFLKLDIIESFKQFDRDFKL